MTEVIFGDLDSPEDFYKCLKEMLTPPKGLIDPVQVRSTFEKNVRWSRVAAYARLINIRTDGSWFIIIYGREREFGYMFESKTWNETKRELSFTVKFTEYGGEKKLIDETDNDVWDDLTRAVWRKLDGFFDFVPYSIEIPKFGWHIPSAKDKEARAAYIEANGRKPPRSLAPPEEVEKPEPPACDSPTARLAELMAIPSPEPEPANPYSPLFDRRRPPPPLPVRRTPSKPRKTRTSVKAAEAAAVAVDDDD